MEGLRKQIEPVTVDVFIRFLTRHHGLLPDAKRAGASGVFEAVSMLQGLDLPAIVWERDVLPARIDKYRPEVLDELCLTGEVGWGRLFPTKRMPDRSRPLASLTRVVPISLFLRSDLEWLDGGARNAEPDALSSPARQVIGLLAEQGAMFAADLVSVTRMLGSQLGDVLGELVSQGLVTADGFAGLRALIAARTSRDEPSRAQRHLVRRRVPLAGSGRWSLWRRPAVPIGEKHKEREGDKETSGQGEFLPVSLSPCLPPQPANTANGSHVDRQAPSPVDTVAQWAWQLLRRWGVVFRDLLEREPGAPRWFELLQVLRRLEARGEIRGGRFISGVAGEQFALGDTVRLLRQLRDEGPQNELVVVTAADPLNLVGILTSHERVTSNASNRIAFLDGVPVAGGDRKRSSLSGRTDRSLAGNCCTTVACCSPVTADERRRNNSRLDGGTSENEASEGQADKGKKPRKNGQTPEASAGKTARPESRFFPRTIPRPFIR